MTSFGATKYFLEMLKSVIKLSSNFDLAVHVVTIINYLSALQQYSEVLIPHRACR